MDHPSCNASFNTATALGTSNTEHICMGHRQRMHACLALACAVAHRLQGSEKLAAAHCTAPTASTLCHGGGPCASTPPLIGWWADPPSEGPDSEPQQDWWVPAFGRGKGRVGAPVCDHALHAGLCRSRASARGIGFPREWARCTAVLNILCRTA